MGELSEAERATLEARLLGGGMAGESLPDVVAAIAVEVADARVAAALEVAGSLLLAKAAEGFGVVGPHDRFHAATWSCGAWLREGDALREVTVALTAAEPDRAVDQ